MEGLDGLLKCSIHIVSFNNPDEYFQHEREVEHERNEDHLCASCGSEVNGTGPRVQRTFTAKLIPDKRTHHRANCKSCQDKEDAAHIQRMIAEGKIKPEQVVK